MALHVVSTTRNRVPYAEMSADQKALAERFHGGMQRRLAERMPELQSANGGRVTLADPSRCHLCVKNMMFCAPLENVESYDLDELHAEARRALMRVFFERPTLLLAVPMIHVPSAGFGLPDTPLVNLLLVAVLLGVVAYFRMSERPTEQLAGAFASLAHRVYKTR
jgi:hypothetical protein